MRVKEKCRGRDSVARSFILAEVSEKCYDEKFSPHLLALDQFSLFGLSNIQTKNPYRFIVAPLLMFSFPLRAHKKDDILASALRGCAGPSANFPITEPVSLGIAMIPR